MHTIYKKWRLSYKQKSHLYPRINTPIMQHCGHIFNWVAIHDKIACQNQYVQHLRTIILYFNTFSICSKRSIHIYLSHAFEYIIKIRKTQYEIVLRTNGNISKLFYILHWVMTSVWGCAILFKYICTRVPQ